MKAIHKMKQTQYSHGYAASARRSFIEILTRVMPFNHVNQINCLLFLLVSNSTTAQAGSRRKLDSRLTPIKLIFFRQSR